MCRYIDIKLQKLLENMIFEHGISMRQFQNQIIDVKIEESEESELATIIF